MTKSKESLIQALPFEAFMRAYHEYGGTGLGFRKCLMAYEAAKIMDASEIQASTRNGGDCGNTKNTAASEASTNKPYNISTKPLDIGLIDSDTLIDCAAFDMAINDNAQYGTGWVKDREHLATFVSYYESCKVQRGEISVIDTALEEAAKIVLNLKPEMNRNKVAEWEACYAALFKQLTELTRQKREIVEFDDVREILEPQCKLGGAWALWNALCAKFHIAKRNDIEGGSSNA